MAADFRFAICNEIFQQASFADACHDASEIGFTGIELAPHTLGEDATLLTGAERGRIRQQMEDENLQFVGLHWLLVSPPGLHITSADPAICSRTWDYFHRAIDLCADLAGCGPQENGVIVLGSPRQRSTNGEMDPRQAIDILAHGLAHAAPHAESLRVTLLIEAIPRRETDVINRLAEADAMVRQIGSPAVQTMFDVHNAADETDTHPDLIARFSPHIRHVHVNEMNGAEPGMGDYDFESLFRALTQVKYKGWISVEAFDFSRPPQEIAKRALARLEAAASSSKGLLD